MIQPHVVGVHNIHDAVFWEAAMKAMRNFWAREWLMRDVGSRHGTNDVSTIIKIAQIDGSLRPNAAMTDVGQSYVTANRHRVEGLKNNTIVYPL